MRIEGKKMVDWRLGTIGFSYPEWKGTFYPAGLPAGQNLNYYSRIFNAVELNTTFYGAPSVEKTHRWAAGTVEDFCFSLKAPKRVTHELRLQNGGPDMRALAEAAAGLKEKMG